MHGKVKTSDTGETLIIWAVSIAALLAAILMDRSGMAPRWHAAIVATVVAFLGVALVFRRKWRFPHFWLVLCLCFMLHVVLCLYVFGQLLGEIGNIGFLWGVPLGFLEGIVLLGLVPAVERSLTPKRRGR
jgi:membrane-associated HD superfamily phosphohydrolase